jgi:ferredoxin-NADP reductase
VGKHVFLYASIGGETVMRAYTPTSQDKDLGHFDLVVKVYRCDMLFCLLFLYRQL